MDYPKGTSSCQIAVCRAPATVIIGVPGTRLTVRYCADCWNNYASEYLVNSPIVLAIHFK